MVRKIALKVRKMSTGMFAVLVVILGGCTQGKKQWLLVLVHRVQWELIYLSVVDYWQVDPAGLTTLAQE